MDDPDFRSRTRHRERPGQWPDVETVFMQKTYQIMKRPL